MDWFENEFDSDLPINESDVEHKDIKYANNIRVIIDKTLLLLNIINISLGNNTWTKLAISAPNIKYFSTSNKSNAVCFTILIK